MNILRQKIDHLSTSNIGNYDKNFSNELSLKIGANDSSIRKALIRLVHLYEKTGFLYEEKKSRIFPYMELILDNWQSALKMEGQLFNIVKFEGKSPTKEKLTSISYWRTTYNSWIAQHLVSTSFPIGVCAMMLRVQAEANFEKQRYKSFQNWFSKSNQYANLVFGTLVKTIGNKYSNVSLYSYLGVNQTCHKSSSLITIVPYKNDMGKSLYQLYCRVRNTIDADAEEINSSDVELEELDQIFQKVGLRRKRFIWLAFQNKISEPVGAVIANRAPFGMNLSLLENRCDLLIDNSLTLDIREIVCHNLLSEASKVYIDSNLNLEYPVSFIPVLTDSVSSKILTSSGAHFFREYNKSIWMKEAFEDWYRHIQKTYESFLYKTKKEKSIYE